MAHRKNVYIISAVIGQASFSTTLTRRKLARRVSVEWSISHESAALTRHYWQAAREMWDENAQQSSRMSLDGFFFDDQVVANAAGRDQPAEPPLVPIQPGVAAIDQPLQGP